MTFVIMNVGSEQLHGNGYGHQSHYEEERYAKASCTKLNKKYGGEKQWIVLPYSEWFDKYNPLVPVYNTITGDGKTPIMIRKSQVGGCCDPSTELYHCM